MATKITRDIIECYLNCKYKGHLKLIGASGTPSDYEEMTTAARASSRESGLAKLVSRFGVEDACRGIAVTSGTLKQWAPLLVDADHGYGNALNVMRTVQELETAGVAAMCIEDTLLPRAYGEKQPSLISLDEGNDCARSNASHNAELMPLAVRG